MQKKLDDITLYRFRVRTADGREAFSPIVATRREPDARLGDDQEVLRADEDEKLAAMLANPRWSADSFSHGDHATMRVDAPGLDGRTVRFLVERRNGETWSDYTVVEAQVKDGLAEAQLDLEHPDPDHPQATEADLRFSCEVAR